MNEIPKGMIVVTSTLTQKIGAVELTHSSSVVMHTSKIHLIQSVLQSAWTQTVKEANHEQL